MIRGIFGRNGHKCITPLVVGVLFLNSSVAARSQASSVPPTASSPFIAPPGQQPPAYEVATIKLPQPDGYASILRVYIQGAYAIPVNSKGWVIGPDWINSAKYVIQGKPPDPVREAMQAMTAAQRGETIKAMQRALLADRFKLKAHFETREMPMYKLVIAKDGSRLKENPDATKGRLLGGASMIRGTAVPIRILLGALESIADIDGRVVVDETGLTGTYDFLLKWAPMEAPADAEVPSLLTAIQEQLGLRLVPTRAPGQVLIIDHIERPSEN